MNKNKKIPFLNRSIWRVPFQITFLFEINKKGEYTSTHLTNDFINMKRMQLKPCVYDQWHCFKFPKLGFQFWSSSLTACNWLELNDISGQSVLCSLIHHFHVSVFDFNVLYYLNEKLIKYFKGINGGTVVGIYTASK